MASTDSTKSAVCASGLSFAATNTTGTKASSQSIGLWRISLRRRFMGSPGLGPEAGDEDCAADGGEEAHGPLRAALIVSGHSLDIVGQQNVFRLRKINWKSGGASLD